MAEYHLDFEKPLVELRKKIEELKSFTTDKNINVNEELKTLEEKAEKMKNEGQDNCRRSIPQTGQKLLVQPEEIHCSAGRTEVVWQTKH